MDRGRGNGYLWIGDGVLKRIADWLEKISAGSMLIGLFQGSVYATALGLLVFGVVLCIQWRQE